MATYPWALLLRRQGIGIEQFPNVKPWIGAVATGPATGRSYDIGKALKTAPTVTADLSQFCSAKAASRPDL
jgi:hypothetical protein